MCVGKTVSAARTVDAITPMNLSRVRCVTAMPGMPATDVGDLGDAHVAHPTAPDEVALCNLPVHPNEDPDFRTGVAAPSGYLLAGRLAAAPQADGGDAPT
jgi:hypothetical protein